VSTILRDHDHSNRISSPDQAERVDRLSARNLHSHFLLRAGRISDSCCELHEYPTPRNLNSLWNFVIEQIEVPMADGDVRTCAGPNRFPSRRSRGKADSRLDEYRPSSAQLDSVEEIAHGRESSA